MEKISEKAQLGIFGLGRMGRNFLINLAKHDVTAVGYDPDEDNRELALKNELGISLVAVGDLNEFISKLATPRNIMMLLPAGSAVDAAIDQLLPHLDTGDLIIDGSDSHFTETERREAELAANNIGFLGVGLAGNDIFIRNGASMMVGGNREYYDRIEHILHATAAQFNRPCAGYVGSGSAGHFVKMVHDGIEYALMQQVAEAYDYMRRVLRMNMIMVQKAFVEWDDEELCSEILSLTKRMLGKYDKETRESMIDLVVDVAGQEGMARRAAQMALELGVPVPTIDAAITMRQISARKAVREEIALLFQSPTNGYNVTSRADPEDVRHALYCGFILAFEQGFSLLRAADEEKSYGLDLREIAGVWSYGSTIWSSVLFKIAKTYFGDEEPPAMLMLDPTFSDILYKNMAGLRKVVASATQCRIPVMALSASLNYYTAFRTERLPTYLIQAQRDYFQARTYQRVDKEGTFHTPDWDEPTYRLPDPDDPDEL